MESSEAMVFDSIQGTKEGGIIWILSKEKALEKRPPIQSKHKNMFEMLKDHEEELLQLPPTNPQMKSDEGWIKRLRKLSKALIKIKNHRTSSFNEEVSQSLKA